jgi:methylmalonyl-CoA/ethylmalonyl-CoA epimerase
MIIDHIGIVVKSLDAGIKQWQSLFGYRQYTEVVENSRQKVKVVFLTKDTSLTIKLVEPVDSTSPVFLFAQRGGGLHHICFKSEALDKDLKDLQNYGARLIASPQPGEAFENDKIAFLLTNQNINIEIITTNKRAKVIK